MVDLGPFAGRDPALREGSQIRIGLTDDRGDLIGFARVITDYTFKALVFDVIVACAHRGKGLGEHLIKLVLEHPDLARVRHFELYCLPDVEPFYQRYGFSTEVGGVHLMRRDGAAEGVARQGAAASPNPVIGRCVQGILALVLA